MRIIAGEAKGRRLKAPKDHGTRPMQDRIKEAVFSSLGSAVVGANVLDLYAGTGSMGLEALSRGASRAVFVERDRKALTVLRDNCAAVDLGGDVIAGDV
ncbi:MAG: RsmD family RNA methyltransferase, partial [Acidimicrobiia bacterium]|nr:RsmD family RNA methyltransferase [Acidimicrobiia bacterium]